MCMEDLEKVLGSRLLLGPSLAVAAIWKVDQQIEYLCFSVFLSFHNIVFQINRNLERREQEYIQYRV